MPGVMSAAPASRASQSAGPCAAGRLALPRG